MIGGMRSGGILKYGKDQMWGEEEAHDDSNWGLPSKRSTSA